MPHLQFTRHAVSVSVSVCVWGKHMKQGQQGPLPLAMAIFVDLFWFSFLYETSFPASPLCCLLLLLLLPFRNSPESSQNYEDEAAKRRTRPERRCRRRRSCNRRLLTAVDSPCCLCCLGCLLLASAQPQLYLPLPL